MQVGKTQYLEVSEKNDDGLFLRDEEGNGVFLAKFFADENLQIGDKTEVFIYQEKGNLKATTEVPYCEVGEYAVMEAVQVLPSGAFMDWGIIKDLFVPFKKQGIGIQEGKNYLVKVYLDEETDLITGTTKFKKTNSVADIDLKEGEEVQLVVLNSSDLGWNVLINKKYFGLVYHSDVYKRLQPFSEEKGFVKTIREDGKIDVTLQPEGYKNIDVYQEKILSELKRKNGIIHLSDKSDPEDIKRLLQMSKKNFKKAIGGLYKDGIIEILPNKIRMK